MNIRMTPFLIAAGIAAVVQIVLTLGSSIASFLMIPIDMTQIPQSPDQFPFQMVQVATLVSCAATILIGVVNIGAGILYAALHNREAGVSPEEGAAGGAASAAVASILGTLTAAVVSMFITPLIMQRIMGAAGIPELQNMPGFPNQPGSPLTVIFGVSMVFGFAGSIVSACFGAVIAAMLGAAGGAITGAFIRRRPSPIPS